MKSGKEKFYINEDDKDIYHILLGLRKKGIPKSEYIKKAIRFYEKNKTTEERINHDELDNLFPRYDKVYDFMMDNHIDMSVYSLNLYKNKKIPVETLIKIYCMTKATNIQFAHTELFKEAINRRFEPGVKSLKIVDSKRKSINKLEVNDMFEALLERISNIEKKPTDEQTPIIIGTMSMKKPGEDDDAVILSEEEFEEMEKRESASKEYI